MQRRARGFTLIETMVVIAVLGVVAAIAAPSFAEFTARSRLRGVANEAYADLQYARSEAVQRNVNVRMTFSAGGYVVDVPSSGQVLRSIAWTGGSSASSAMQVVFEPVRGTATVSNGPTVISSVGTAASARLNVNAVGRPAICVVSGVLGGMKSC